MIDMTREELISEVAKLDKKIKLLGGKYMFDKNWFIMQNTGKVYMLQSTYDKSKGVYNDDLIILIPKFVNVCRVNPWGIQRDKKIIHLAVQGDGLEHIDTFKQSIKQLSIQGATRVPQDLYREVTVRNCIKLSQGIKYIGSYAFRVEDGCIVDIQAITDATIDIDFLSVVRRKRLGVELPIKDLKILCNRNQYEFFYNNKQFKYKNYLSCVDDGR